MKGTSSGYDTALLGLELLVSPSSSPRRRLGRLAGLYFRKSKAVFLADHLVGLAMISSLLIGVGDPSPFT